ncbi:CatB-related O-acetyltransferase [Paracoccus thiocyanatus]|nr:CatB-related O-acetyltransferase [Paracoccus thiocyanatus]
MGNMLSAKLERFIARTLQADQPLSPRALRKIGIRRPAHLKHLLFEERVSIDSGAVGPGNRIFFGAYSYINAGGYMHGQVFVGRYCSIGRRVSIGAAAHDMTGLTTSPRLAKRGQDGTCTASELERIGARPHRIDMPTIIESDVWIGDGAVIFPGVRIGTGAVIGANTIVRRDVEPYAVMAGSSSVPLRYRFSEAIRAELLASRWWDMPHDTLSRLPLGNICRLLPENGSIAQQDGFASKPRYSLSLWKKNLTAYLKARLRRTG